MKIKFLLPHSFKTIGWILFFPALALGAFQLFSSYEPDWLEAKVPALFYGQWSFDPEGQLNWPVVKIITNNLADEICAVLLLIAALFLVFARERYEDEFIMKLRLESILWAALVNGLLLLFCIVFIYDLTFFYVMVFNLFLLFLLFIVRFHWVLYKFRSEDE